MADNDYSLRFKGYEIETDIPYLNDDAEDQSVDVTLVLPSGERLVATFVTLEYLKAMRQLHRQTGDFCNGKYFTTSGMIEIEEISEENIRKTIDDLIEQESLHIIFDDVKKL